MIGWIDASSGASGDMLLGALVDAGVGLEVIQRAVDAVIPEPVTLRTEQVSRGGFAATRVHVDDTDSHTQRSWREIRSLGLAPRARRTFQLLAAAEAAVHGCPVEDVHFHEVGALDSIADVVGVCAGLDQLTADGLDRLVVSTVAVGGGVIATEHGTLGVPAPATAELLRGRPSIGGPIDAELCTPTGAALLVANADEWGHQPAMTVTELGVGAGGRDPVGHPNVLRLLLGSEQPGPDSPDGTVLLQTNVDDLDPRLWPAVLETLLAAGAADAWLTPILMKKGRPAHTLSVLVTEGRASALRREIFRHTSAIGLREQPVIKHALARTLHTVYVDGHRVDVKIASLAGEVLNTQPEYEHVASAARALDLPIKTVLARAVAAAQKE